jgi:hypothetical protein
MSMFYDQDADTERDDATMAFAPEAIEEAYYGRGGGGGGGPAASAIPTTWADPVDHAARWAGPVYEERDPTPPEQGYVWTTKDLRRAHASPVDRHQRNLRAVISVAIVALALAVVALLVVPPKNSPARIKLNTVRPVTPTTLAPTTPTTAAAIAPGPQTTTAPAPSPIITLPANQPSRFPTSNGGTASNTSGAAGVPVYYVAGGGPAGFKVPTVVDGVTMPYPGQAPTAAQVRAASTIPYTCPANASCGGINWAAIDALAGEGWGPAKP